MNNTDNSFFNERDLFGIVKRFCIEGVDFVNAVNTGVINDTFIVGSSSSNKKYILQKLHDIFSFDLFYDNEAVISHLESHRHVTPGLIYTDEGLPGLTDGSGMWRMMTFIPGRTVIKPNSALAGSSGSILAGFHKIFLNFDYQFKHKIQGFHDTSSSIKKLQKSLSAFNGSDKYKQLEVPGGFVLNEYEENCLDLNDLPQRVVHGDPKISNFIFENTKDKAVCLIDLDTVSRDNLVMELGDAIRSMCHSREAGSPVFNTDIFTSFIEGYFSSADFLTNPEISAIIKGVQLVTLDLCARYINDAFEEKYFKLDHSKYDSLYEQNSKKASDLISFYRETQKNEEYLDGIIYNCSKD